MINTDLKIMSKLQVTEMIRACSLLRVGSSQLSQLNQLDSLSFFLVRYLLNHGQQPSRTLGERFSLLCGFSGQNACILHPPPSQLQAG